MNDLIKNYFTFIFFQYEREINNSPLQESLISYKSKRSDFGSELLGDNVSLHWSLVDQPLWQRETSYETADKPRIRQARQQLSAYADEASWNCKQGRKQA